MVHAAYFYKITIFNTMVFIINTMALLSKTSNITLVSGVSIITIVIVIFAFLLDHIYDHKSVLFNFGPSDSLVFIGITIDTWVKYIILVMFMLFLEVLDLLQEEYIDPFINMLYNANDRSNQTDLQPYTWFELYCINHFSLASHGLREILSIIIITIQIPLAVLVWLLKELARIYFVIEITNNWFVLNDRGVEVDNNIIKRRRNRAEL